MFEFGFFLCLSLVFLIWHQWPDDNLHLVFCDVGQGDAILVAHGFDQILIDGGPDNSVLSCLSENMPFWDRKIELILLTHPDSDHYTGLVQVLERYKVSKFGANPFGEKNDLKFLKLQNLLSEQEVYTFFPRQGDKIRLGLISFDIIWPTPLKLKEVDSLESISSKTTNGFLFIDGKLFNVNEFSIIAHLKFGQFDALLTGDAPFLVTQTLAWRKRLPRVEVLKVPHHGSGIDNPDELYQAVKPKLGIICVGKNTFGHPSAIPVKIW